MKVTVEISARHLHLTKEDYELLFGQSKPKVIKHLSQKGEFASDKIVEVSTDGKERLNTRFLGPFRDSTQVELTRTDAYKLSINPPLAECACKTIGSKMILFGPNGSIVRPAAIVSHRHLHISPEKAESLGLKEDGMVKVRISGARALTFENVLVRIDPAFHLDVHIDTDEANAAGISKTTVGELII